MSKKLGFAEWCIENGFDDVKAVYDHCFNAIRDTAARVGVDLEYGNFDLSKSHKASRLKFLDKAHKGKVAAYIEIKRKSVKGVGNTSHEFTFPIFNFHTFKGGEFTETFSTESALWELYKNNRPISVSPISSRTPSFDYAADEKRRAKWNAEQFAKWSAELDAGSDDLSNSLYLHSKFSEWSVSACEALAKAGVKHVHDERGGCLLVPLRNAKSEIIGFQKIYDELINFARKGEEALWRNKDYRFSGGKAGAFIRIGDADKTDDYVFVAEGLATGLSVYLATGKAVFCAMDAGNLGAVLASVKALGYRRPVIAADNDCHEDASKGNTGMFSALKAAKAHGARIFVAEFDGQKVDFNDVLLLAGLNALKKQLVFRSNKFELCPKSNVFDGAVQLLSVCGKNSVKKHIWFCCATAVSNQFLMDLKVAESLISNMLVARGYTTEEAIDFVSKTMSKALYCAVKRSKTKHESSFESVEKKGCTGLSYEDIAEYVLGNEGIHLCNWEMGRGKTILGGHVFDLAAKRGLTTAYICHRQSLVANSSNRLKSTSYKDVNSKNDMMLEDTLATCINSIINPRFFDYVTKFCEVIFIDEIRQTLEHVAIGTIKTNERKLVYDALVMAINNAKFVLGSDADLNQLTVDWLKETFPHKKLFALTLERNEPIAEIQYGYYEAAFNKAIESALSGVATLIQCDSIKAAEAVYQKVNRPHLKVLLVTANNKADTDQAKFLANPNDEIANWDVVVHSPVISTGVSITNEHIKAHFALFRGVLPENEVMQMIGRNRKSQLITIGFNDKHTRNRMNDFDTLVTGETKARARVVNGEVVFDPLDTFRMKITAAHNDSLNDLENQALLLMRLKGYRISRFEGDKAIDELMDARKKARDVHCNGVISADDISSMDADKLEKADSITQDESYKLERHNVIYELALPSTHQVVDDDVLFYDRGRIVSTIHNREIAEATPEQRMAVDVKNDGFKSVSKGKHIDVVRALIGDRVMDQYHAVLIAQYLNDHHAELAAVGLGNYSKMSKYPIRMLNDFLERFGYGLVSFKISTGSRKGDRVYKMAGDTRINDVVGRRILQNVFKSVMTEKVADGA